MGAIQEVRTGNPALLVDPTVRRWHEMIKQGGEQGVKAAGELIAAQANKRLPDVMKDPQLSRSIWQKHTAIMEKYNEPGRFTAFIG